MKKQSVLLAVLFLVIGLAGTMAPQQAEAQKLLTKWYIGGSAGNTDVGVAGWDDDFSIKGFGGYNINKNIAVEAAFIDFGSFDSKVAPGISIDVFGVETSVVGKISLGRFSLLGKRECYFGMLKSSIPFFLLVQIQGLIPHMDLVLSTTSRTVDGTCVPNGKNSRTSVAVIWS